MSYLQEIASPQKKRRSIRKVGDSAQYALLPSPALAPAPQDDSTQQQSALANTSLHGEVRVIQVNAYAGTGKTSSLTSLAANNPSKRCLYIAYNKSAQQDASTRFGPNTRCTTVHGLAFGAVGKKYAHKLNNLRAIDIINRAQLGWNWEFAGAVLSTITAWTVSDWDQFPELPCSVEGPIYGDLNLLKEIAKVAKQVWYWMCDPKDEMPMTHDGYLKLYQLSKPRIMCDLLMLDEAQDTNPVTWAIVRSQQHCPIVVVGDRYQSIYKFRGAINAMDSTKPDLSYPLTQSFRFGHRVANLASNLLRQFWLESRPVEGLGPDTTFSPPPPDQPFALICRTNALVFSHAVENLHAGKTLGFVGGVANYGFDKLLDVHYLATDRNDLIKDRFIKKFDSIQNFQDYADESGDFEATRQLDIASEYGQSLEHLIPQIYKAAKSDLSKAQITLTTAHRSKGMTVDHVVLADDFPEIFSAQGKPLPEEELDRQEINLLYVAATRARRTLALNSTAQQLAR